MIKVTVFNEFKHEKESEEVKNIYPDGIHIALKKKLEDQDIVIRTVTLDDKECGLTEEILNDTDVIIWWGHIAHNEVPDHVAKRVQEHILSGMGGIFLHSAHHSKPFKLLMGTTCNLSWREDADSELVWVCNPYHPITQGIDRFLKIDHVETYSEPFDIPKPDELVFIGGYSGGEVFRSGCCWQRGRGKIFYFQPGHETFPIFYNEDILKVIKNAIYWAYNEKGQNKIDCPNIKKLEQK